MTAQPDPAALGFVLKAFRVSVEGFASWNYYARSRSAALGKAYGDWRELRDEGDFGTFLKIARCEREDGFKPARFGDPITVNRKPAFFVTNDRQYVQMVWPGSDHVSNAHPLEVLPIEYRPETYRSEKFDAL